MQIHCIPWVTVDISIYFRAVKLNTAESLSHGLKVATLNKLFLFPVSVPQKELTHRLKGKAHQSDFFCLQNELVGVLPYGLGLHVQCISIILECVKRMKFGNVSSKCVTRYLHLLVQYFPNNIHIFQLINIWSLLSVHCD